MLRVQYKLVRTTLNLLNSFDHGSLKEHTPSLKTPQTPNSNPNPECRSSCQRKALFQALFASTFPQRCAASNCWLGNGFTRKVPLVISLVRTEDKYGAYLCSCLTRARLLVGLREVNEYSVGAYSSIRLSLAGYCP